MSLEKTQLTNVAKVFNGKTPSRAEQRSEGHPVLKIRDVSELGEFRGKFESFVEPEFARKYSEKLVREGDVLILNAAHNSDYVGSKTFRAQQATFGALATGEWLVIRPRQEILSAAYLGHWVNFPRTRRQVRELVNGIHLYPKDVARLELQLPPLAEQRRIADILDKAGALRALRRAASTALGDLTQSMFLDLFGDPTINPEKWPMKSLKSLGTIKTGGTPPSSKSGMFGGTIPFMTPGDLESDQPAKRTLTEAGAIEAEIVREGSTLVCCIGATIGKMKNVSVRSAFNQQLNAIEWSDAVDDNYGLGVLRFFKAHIARWGASTTLPILKKSSFEKIEIPVAPLELQRDFARRVIAIESLKSHHRAALAELDTLFASLQNSAFRGEL